MQFAVLAHLVVGFFMFSNTAVFQHYEDFYLNGIASENRFFQNLFSANNSRLK
jgi:hypothetical protein